MSKIIEFGYDEWIVNGRVVCCRSAQQQTCLAAEFLHSNPTKFHDQQLEQATTQLNKILEEVAASSHGRGDLSILLTPDGLFLAWTQSSHDGIVLHKVDEIRKFLEISFDSDTQTEKTD